MEPLRVLDREVLADQARADVLAVDRDDLAVRPVVERDLADAPHGDRVGDAEQDRHDEEDLEADEGLADEVERLTWFSPIPGMVETRRSMSLMPTNGAMTPPSP